MQRLARWSVPPEILEAIRRQFAVAHGVRDVAVAEVVLKAPRIHALVRQLVAAGVPQHVRMHDELELGCNAEPGDHLAEACGRERRIAFRYEYERRLRALAFQAA